MKPTIFELKPLIFDLKPLIFDLKQLESELEQLLRDFEPERSQVRTRRGRLLPGRGEAEPLRSKPKRHRGEPPSPRDGPLSERGEVRSPRDEVPSAPGGLKVDRARTLIMRGELKLRRGELSQRHERVGAKTALPFTGSGGIFPCGISRSHIMRIKVTLLCLWLLFSGAPLAAQINEREKQEQEAERRKVLERKTYALVDEIATGALSLKLPENRSYVLAAAADLLWDHDQKRARNLFWDATTTLNLLNNFVDVDANGLASKSAKPSANEKEKSINEYMSFFQLRQELLQQIARRDPQFALDILRATRQVPVEPPAEWTKNGFSLPDDHVLEQDIATQAALRDPQKAMQLARESLAKGIAFQLFQLLFTLNQQDRELGARFAGEIIDKLRGRNIATDQQATQIAISLLTMSRNPTGAYTTGSNLPVLQLAPEQRRDVIEMITNAALTESANGNLLFELSTIKAEIKEFTPERLAPIERKLASFSQTLNQEQKLSNEYNELFEKGSPEELFRFANKAGTEHPDMVLQAIDLAVVRKRADSMRELINKEVTDDSRRNSLLDTLDTLQLDYAVEQGDTETLENALARVRRPEERARAMSEIAVTLEKRGDHDEALKLLDEAQTLIKTDFNSRTQVNALLALVGAYSLVEPGRAFVIIERAIDRANDDMTKLLLIDKLVKTGAIKKGELRMRTAGTLPIDYSVFKYGKSITALANADFDRTRAAADRFERYELRLMARLLLAQSLLQPQSPKQ